MQIRKGFTLIELLVVIAIIALLMSIVMPALGKAKIIAEELLCKANLHQYQIATEMYLSDNRDRFPNAWSSLYSSASEFGGESQRYCRWHNEDYNLENDPYDTSNTRCAGPYWPYISVKDAHVCPTFKKIGKKYGDLHANHDPSIPINPIFGYSMNNMELTAADDGRKKSEIRSPSQTFLWGEENPWKLNDEDGNLLSKYTLNDNSLAIETDGSRDNFGSFHKISKAQLAEQLPEVSSGYGTYNNVGSSHAIMCDGSVKVVTPLEADKYDGSFRERK